MEGYGETEGGNRGVVGGKHECLQREEKESGKRTKEEGQCCFVVSMLGCFQSEWKRVWCS